MMSTTSTVLTALIIGDILGSKEKEGRAGTIEQQVEVRFTEVLLCLSFVFC